MIVKHIDAEGFAWTVQVPSNTPEDEWEYGAILGPFGLEELNITEQERKELQQGLVKAGLYNAETLLNRRRELRRLVVSLGFPETLERELTGIYQRHWYDQ